jgi:transcriptional regulator with XRE-family HTH domain
MSTQIDLLGAVRAELKARKGKLREVADESGIAYDTVLRLLNGENDPAYGKVLAMYRYLFGTLAPSRAHITAGRVVAAESKAA